MLKILSRIRYVLKPHVILPVLLAVALLVFAFSLGDLNEVVARVVRLPDHVLWLSLAAAACYLACKALQLRLMLIQIGVRIPARPFWLAFAAGELTLTLPLGLFSQNWVLSAARRVHIGRSSAATVMMVLAEIAVVFLFLAIVGIPGWPATRALALVVLVGFALLLLSLVLFEQRARALVSGVRHQWARHGAQVGLEMVLGMRKLATPVMLAISVMLAAVYLGALTFAFWTIGRGMDVAHLDYVTAATIYGFALAVILVGAGLLSQIGTMEVLGMLAAHEFGISYTDGLAMMLGFRIVWTGAVWLLCLPIVALMWRELPSRGARKSADRGKKGSR